MSEKFLAIETSSPRLSLAAGDEARALAVYRGPLHWRHAESLFDGFEALLRRVRWKPAMLSGIAVSTGPGSFTGIRIGLAAARTLAQTLRVPVAGVNALESIAWRLRGRADYVCPMIDALRGGIFTALYRSGTVGDLVRVRKESHLPADEWAHRLKRLARGRRVIFAGDAWRGHGRLFRRALGRDAVAAPEADWYPRAEAVLEIGRSRIRHARPGAYSEAVPLYLRPAAAQERRRGSASR